MEKNNKKNQKKISSDTPSDCQFPGNFENRQKREMKTTSDEDKKDKNNLISQIIQ